MRVFLHNFVFVFFNICCFLGVGDNPDVVRADGEVSDPLLDLSEGSRHHKPILVSAVETQPLIVRPVIFNSKILGLIVMNFLSAKILYLPFNDDCVISLTRSAMQDWWAGKHSSTLFLSSAEISDQRMTAATAAAGGS